MSHSPNFFIFLGEFHYPRGGWGDFMGVADSVAEAHKQIANTHSSITVDWWQIVDAKTLKVVEES